MTKHSKIADHGSHAAEEIVAVATGAPKARVSRSGHGFEKAKFKRVSLDEIAPRPFSLRRLPSDQADGELAKSIRIAGGLLSPLVVRQIDDDDSYQLIAGSRRLSAIRQLVATQQLKLETVPVLVVKTNETGARALALIENLQRLDLTPLERGEALGALKEALGAESWAEVGRHVGLSKARVSQLVALAEVPDSVRSLVAEGRLKEAQVRELRRVAGDNKAVLVAAAPLAADDKIAVDQIEAMVEAVRHSVHNVNDTEYKERRTRPSASVQIAARLRGTVAFLKRKSDEGGEDLDRAQFVTDIEAHIHECERIAHQLTPPDGDSATEG